jgi:hypothetical protein
VHDSTHFTRKVIEAKSTNFHRRRPPASPGEAGAGQPGRAAPVLLFEPEGLPPYSPMLGGVNSFIPFITVKLISNNAPQIDFIFAEWIDMRSQFTPRGS